jgi:hypothetical protein
MIEITSFQHFGEGLDGWSYRGHDRCRRPLADNVALLVFASDLGGWEGKYGTELRETHVRTVESTTDGHELSAPIRIAAPLQGDQLEIRTICLEIDGDADLDVLLEDAAHGFEVSIGGYQPRPWHDPFLAFGSSWWTPNDVAYRTLFEDCWAVSTANPVVGGREPLQTAVAGDAGRDTVARHLSQRGITRLISFDSDGTTSVERRRYQHRTESTDTAIGITYTA